MRLKFALVVLVALSAGPQLAADESTTDGRNLYEWCAVAPIVVSARIDGEDGRWTRLVVEEVLRGDLSTGDRIRADHRQANRERGSQADRLRFDPQVRYLLLLEPSPRQREGDPPSFVIVRGVRGARPLPPEGSEALISAVRAFVDVQSLGDFSETWDRYRALLDGPNPFVTETILDQYLKFERGDRDLPGTLEPLLDHPRPSVRAKSARVFALVVEQSGDPSDPAFSAARRTLLAKARRDPAVEVRVAATSAVGAFGDPEAVAVLREIARNDPDQAVRYEAERILFDRGSVRTSTGSDRQD